MTIEQIKEMVAGNQYDFLRTNPHLAGKIIFLTLGGSHAYGTNVETSDVDVRGCALKAVPITESRGFFRWLRNTTVAPTAERSRQRPLAPGTNRGTHQGCARTLHQVFR